MSEGEPKWGFYDLLDPVQLGVIYEMFMLNANENGMNSEKARDYLFYANEVKEAIDSNCGFEEYVNGDEHNKPLQPYCRKLADYDNRLGFNPS